MSAAGRHLLIVYDGLPYRKGGAETRLLAIGAGLAARGWRVTWIGLAPPGTPRAARIEGVDCLALGTECTRRGRRRGLRDVLRFCRMLARWRVPDDVDCVVAGQSPWLHIPILHAKLGPRVPLVIDCWELWGGWWRSYYGALLGTAGWWGEHLAIRCADLLASISPQARSGIMAHGIAEQRVFDAPNGADVALADSLAATRNWREIAYFGRLVPHKNVDMLIGAFARVVREQPDVRLVVIGGGDDQAALAALAHRLGVAQHVEFSGAVADHRAALARLKAAAIAVQPSTSEGGGSVAVHEANACGLPVIAVRHPQGIDPALIVEGVNGAWIDRAEPEPLARMLSTLLADRAGLEQLSAHARAMAAAHDWSRTVDAYERALLGLATDAGPPAAQVRSTDALDHGRQVGPVVP